MEFVLTNRRSLSGKRPKSASGKSSSSQFSLSAKRNVNTKATEYVTFGFFLLLVTLDNYIQVKSIMGRYPQRLLHWFLKQERCGKLMIIVFIYVVVQFYP